MIESERCLKRKALGGLIFTFREILGKKGQNCQVFLHLKYERIVRRLKQLPYILAYKPTLSLGWTIKVENLRSKEACSAICANKGQQKSVVFDIISFNLFRIVDLNCRPSTFLITKFSKKNFVYTRVYSAQF